MRPRVSPMEWTRTPDVMLIVPSRQRASRQAHFLLCRLVAEAVGLALDRRIDRAIRGRVFAQGETLGAHVAKLTLRRRHRRRG